MKWRLNTYLNSGSPLRKRSVQILYLIFLILIFAFIPQAKPKHDDLRGETAQYSITSHSSSKVNTLIFLHLVKDEQETYEALKYASLEIEQSTDNCLNYIEDLQLRLAREKMPRISWLRPSGLNPKTSDSLRQAIARYTDHLGVLIGVEHRNALNSMLPSKKYLEDRSGKLFSFHDYFFRDKDKEETEVFLQQLISRVEQTQSYALQILTESIAHNIKDVRQFRDLKLSEEENLLDIYHVKSLSHFFKKIERQSTQKVKRSIGKRSSDLFVERFCDNSLFEQDFIHYRLNFEPRSENVTIIVESAQGKAYFSMPQSGPFIYFPQHSGTYHLRFQRGTLELTDELTVMEKFKALTVNQLFSTSKNNLNLNPKLKSLPYPLQISVNQGEVLQENGQWMVLRAPVGQLRMDISCNTTYGQITVARETVEIVPKERPELQLLGLANGSTISLTQLQKARAVELKNGKQYQVMRFEASIYNQYSGARSRMYLNKGESFSPSLLQAISQMIRGDQLIIENTVLSMGSEVITLDPFALTIR